MLWLGFWVVKLSVPQLLLSDLCTNGLLFLWYCCITVLCCFSLFGTPLDIIS